ncbi:MAG: hypothetical protein U0R64_00025 [Candidatus Nanopelagicales bacterium]
MIDDRDLVPLADFLAERSRDLVEAGFDPEVCLAVTATCRDEIMAPLRAGVRAHWHRAFDFSSLTGLPLAGVTGAAAALSHAPPVADRVRLVVFAMPHVGVLPDGTPGRVWRRGQAEPTTACGALIAALEWAAATDRTREVPTIDPEDPEQSLVRNRLLQVEPYLGDTDLWRATELVRSVMSRDARALFLRPGPHPIDLAVVSGIVVHTTDGDLVLPAPSHVATGRPTPTIDT